MKRYSFLLLSVCLILSTPIFGQNELSKKEVKDLVEQYFIIKDVPIRYYSNILIRLDGNPSHEDSLIVQELVDTLNPLIATWDVYIIREKTANLILDINNPIGELYGKTRLSNRKEQEIVQSKIIVSIPPDASFLERKKILYFNLLKALIFYNPNKDLETKLPGSVFSVKNPSDITFNPVDYQLLAGLYSSKFDDELTAPINPTKNAISSRQIFILATILSNLVSTLFLLWMFLSGAFKNHNYIFEEYFKQGLLVLVAFIIGIILSVFVPMIISDLYIDSVSVFVPIIALTIGCLIIGLLTIIILFLSEVKILKCNTSLSLHVIFPFLTTTIIPTALIFILVKFGSSKLSTRFLAGDGFRLIINMVSITMSIAIYRAFFIFLTKKSESIINQKDVELARMSELHRKAELQSLRAKINPHFLYNSLNSIASLASIDSKKTEQMALSLSDFFKYSINREQKQTNPLSEELKAVETYLEIEKVRFGDRLTYSIECPDSLKSVEIPQLLIQPLVENAVKHGISKLLKDGVIQIIISALESEQISIRVYDNGPDFPNGPMSGFGIRNTHERLQLLYDDKASMNWKNQPEKYFELIFPQQPSARSFKPVQYSVEIPNYTQPQQTGKSRMRKLMNTIWVIAAFLVMAGVLFRIQHYPHGNLLLAIGLTSGLVMAILEGVRQMITTKDNE
ncbi:histidine kinase [uncultured Draconibacterium sp.]|uniref:histidine kinase n=1 Tax=uncultured Draconibacterium sp. TaxID=1573823 RepID=UPI0029C8F800|nr:histidine kinase [uncultured Draconibacterium sp.]